MKNWPWYGYIILAIIVLGAFYLFYYKPKNTEIKNLEAERIKVEQEVAQLRLKKQQLDKIEAELVSLDSQLKELYAIIPEKKETSDILRKIQQLAYDSRLIITRFAPKDEINKDFYSEWPIPIEITGSYNNLGIFFDRLSQFSRLFTVENFSIKALQKQTEAETIAATWTAKTYFFIKEAPQQQTTPQKTGKEK
jgi:type IV pilus assembly protein PilO